MRVDELPRVRNGNAREATPARTRSTARDVRERSDRMLERLLDYLRQPSVSLTGEGFPEATTRTVREVAAAGLEPVVLETSGRPAVFGQCQGPAGAPTVLIYGHYDVHPGGDRAQWSTPPFEPTIRAERIWGRGVADNKGQHFAHLEAVRLLLERDGSLPCSVKMLLDGEEEVGSPNLGSLVQRHRELLAADLVIWSDGPVHESGAWCVRHGSRGLLALRLTAHGPRRRLHAGSFGNLAPNPARTLVEAIAGMRNSDGTVAVAGFYDDIRPLATIEQAALRRATLDDHTLLEAIGSNSFEVGLEAVPPMERLAALPSLSVTALKAGEAGSASIPTVAEAWLDVRLVADQTPEGVAEAIRKHLATHGSEISIEVLEAVPPSRVPFDNPFTPVVARALSAATGKPPLLVPGYGGTVPDYVWSSRLGVPSLGVPFANVDESNHAPDENLEIERFLIAVHISVSVLTALGQSVHASESP
jgi:acetylornithine deacetylase/succinyl-diaminopimelate desuccinylase-like protein